MKTVDEFIQELQAGIQSGKWTGAHRIASLSDEMGTAHDPGLKVGKLYENDQGRLYWSKGLAGKSPQRVEVLQIE